MGLPTSADSAAPPLPSDRRSTARRILLDALLLGGLADALVHSGFGVGFSVWMLVLAGTFIHFARRRGDGVSREQLGWLAAAVFFGAAFAWRDSSSLLFYDFVAVLVALSLLASTSSRASPMRSILGQRVRDVGQALARVVSAGLTAIPRAIGAAAFVDVPNAWRGERTKSLLRATLITVPLLFVFALLLSSADPLFGSLLRLPKIDVGEVISHLFVGGVFAWVAGSGLYTAVLDDRPAKRLRDGMPLTLGSLDVTIVLGALVALFLLFVGVQIEWLFGGEQLVRSTTGLSYAQYARKGFFELVMVSLLVLPVLLGTRAALRDEDAVAVRRHRLLALPLLVLLGGVMASAFGRMALYVHFYGLSTDRTFASVFMAWLAMVFAWFGLTVLRGRTRDFAAGMTITGFLTLAALNVVNPEQLVARVNIERAGTALRVADSLAVSDHKPASVDAPLDYWYLTSRLEGDAVGEVVGALVAQPVSPVAAPSRVTEVKARCDAVRRLLQRWGKAGSEPVAQHRDWRRWNLGAWRAAAAVQGNEAALRAVTCLDASGEAPFGDRESRPVRPGEQGYTPPNPH
ncbi:MAG TPA: DUF4173 domain-containing protein [Gemmatimonadaceae bacterium]